MNKTNSMGKGSDREEDGAGVSVCGEEEMMKKKMTKIRGKVRLMKKNVLDVNDFRASLLDRIDELLGKGVSLQLISENRPDPGNNLLCSH